MRLALCQMNATVGDLSGNTQRILDGIEAAKQARAELVLFPELALTGYPPEDLLLREHFLQDTGAQLQRIATAAEGIVAIVGFPERIPGAVRGPEPGSPGPIATVLYNAAAVLAGGAVAQVYRKVHLPNYGVFDEQRYFKSGDPGGTVIELAGLGIGVGQQDSTELRVGVRQQDSTRQEADTDQRVGVTVCEDLWVAGAPATSEAGAGATLIVNISASPYHAGKGLERERLFAERARETQAHIAFCGMVGGQDELVFDGHSFMLDPHGETIARGAQFAEDLVVCDVDVSLGGDLRARTRARVGRPFAHNHPSTRSRLVSCLCARGPFGQEVGVEHGRGAQLLTVVLNRQVDQLVHELRERKSGGLPQVEGERARDGV